MDLVEQAAARPLVLTLQPDVESQRFFDAQRDRFFPPAINYLPAHITLFHHLPPSELPRIKADLRELTDAQTAFPVAVTGIRNLGRGVAYLLESPAANWASLLTPQDRPKFQPHTTIQNKVTPEEARSTVALLGGTLRPPIQATGLQLWHYDGGPWESIEIYRLT